MAKNPFTADWVNGVLWVHANGRVISVNPRGKKRASKRAQSHGNGNEDCEVTAPMPGKITKVFVAKGDVVTQGQALVVMEAMKMEYTLQAEIAGKVTDVRAEVGQQVGLGEQLIYLSGKP
ncbi:MAG TPA: acetyl-CoA carboxylase biotin carboxyl carrier protein subunit [Pseudobdellovibrionaceae bacterium]|jgi:biotin carboxyl carrier protein|nr:acetyl-CoA carboxylase biotin carboxyl carrier protein subunit [Pseudobdellovibrionaceae bacterium]